MGINGHIEYRFRQMTTAILGLLIERGCDERYHN